MISIICYIIINYNILNEVAMPTYSELAYCLLINPGNRSSTNVNAGDKIPDSNY